MATNPKTIKRIVRILTLALKKGGPDGPGVVGRAGLRQWQYDLVRRIERELEK